MVAINYDWDELEDNIDDEYDDAGETTLEYTTEPDLYGNLISQRRDGQSSFFHLDAIGSTLALTNASGTVTDTSAYTAFGEVTEQTGSTVNPFQYVGQKGYYGDVLTSECILRRRPYAPPRARWLTLDPPEIAGEDINLYRYARNSPLLAIDPSGAVTEDVRRACSTPAARPPLKSYSAKACNYPDTIMWVELFVEELRNGCCKMHSLTVPGLNDDCNSKCRARYAWPVNCVCTGMGNRPVDACIRGCLQCLYDKSGSIFPNVGDHEWCLKACATVVQQIDFYSRLAAVIEACARRKPMHVPDKCGPTGGVIADDDRDRMNRLPDPGERSPHRCRDCDIEHLEPK